jgi:hypothetical protein
MASLLAPVGSRGRTLTQASPCSAEAEAWRFSHQCGALNAQPLLGNDSTVGSVSTARRMVPRPRFVVAGAAVLLAAMRPPATGRAITIMRAAVPSCMRTGILSTAGATILAVASAAVLTVTRSGVLFAAETAILAVTPSGMLFAAETAIPSVTCTTALAVARTAVPAVRIVSFVARAGESLKRRGVRRKTAVLSRDRLPRETLDVAQLATLLGVTQRDGNTGRPGAGRASDTMHVAFRHVGQLEVHHMRHLINVDAAGGDVSCDQDSRLGGAERS